MASHFLTGQKESFFARRLIRLWRDDQSALRKGDQVQSVIPLDQMGSVMLPVITWGFVD
jgi:hypothetical protein